MPTDTKEQHLPHVVRVDADVCVNCHMCISVCPVKFCNDGSGDYVAVDPDLCLGCGRCVEACTHEARLYCDDSQEFFSGLEAGERTVAIVAPSVAANFPHRYLRLNGWLRSLGVDAVFDVSFGAELSARSYVELMRKGGDATIIAQPCPAVVTYVQTYRPGLLPHLSPVDSPMLHLIKMIRKHHPEFGGHRIAAISPCLAKKREFHETGLGDFNVTFRSVHEKLEREGIDLDAFPETPYVNPAPERAVLFPTPGGLMRTVERWVPDVASRTRRVEGESAVYPYLEKLEEVLESGGESVPLLVDCLNCHAGCNVGPGSITRDESLDEVEHRVEERKNGLLDRAREEARHQGVAADRTRDETIERYWDPDLFRRDYRDLSAVSALRIPTAAEQAEIYRRMHKNTERDMLNCASCGYDSCRTMSVAIHNGLNRPENCHHYLVAERARAQQSLSQKERRLATILDSSLEGFLQDDLDGVITDVNDAMCAMFGRPREEVIGTSILDLFHPEDAESIRENLALRARHETSRYELRIPRPDGTLVNCLCHGTPFYDEENLPTGSFAMITDISGMKQAQLELAQHRDHLEEMVQERTRSLQEEIQQRAEAEEALRSSDTQLRKIFDRTPLAVFMVDCETRRIIEANSVALEIIGASREELIGQPCSLICTAEVSACPILDQGEKVENSEKTLVPLHGPPIPVLKTVVPIRLDGRKCLLESFVDISELKQTQIAMRNAKETAESASRAKSDFLANMSHEIRTPMNALTGLTHLALQTDLSPKQRNYLTKIQAASQSLLGIINSILDFSKIEAGKMEIESIPFSLEEITGRILDVFGQRAQEQGLALVFDFAPDVPGSLVGDPLRLQQVFANLVGNALKFTEEGRVSITARCTGRMGGSAQLEFEVRDTGIGMTEEHLAKVFDAFNQADESTTRQFGGTGLGLSISRRLVELMGGRISVESQPGSGTAFTFRITFALPDLDSDAPEAVEAGLVDARVLVLGDEEDRLALTLRLERLDMRVEEAASLEEGMVLLHRSEADDPYRLVVVDWNLDDIRRLDVFRVLRSCQGEYEPRILVVSGYWNQRLSEDLESDHIDAFLPKPFTLSSLQDTVVQLLPGIPKASTRGSDVPDLKGLRVLLAEDNPVNQEVALGLLESTGCEVVVATNGREAVREASAGEFDLILMDVQMPEMDGYEATRRLRTIQGRAGLSRTPILAMTANAMLGDQKAAMDAGMDSHIAKPVDPAQLYRELARWSGRDFGAPEESAPAAGTADAPVIDVEAALVYMGGDRDLFERLLGRFVSDYPETDDRIGEALAQEARDDAVRLAHSLKGVAGNLGIKTLQAAAASLESALKEGRAETAARRGFREALTEAITAAEKILAGTPTNV